jgi:type III restriction enzyme
VAEGQVVDASPIINDPYVEPTRHWHFEEGHAPVIREGRRASGYLPPGGTDGQLSITGDLVQIDLVNDVRERVRRWRQEGYPGATAVTRDLLDRWFDEEREPGLRPFFAQREALETLVFLTEAPADRRVGLDIPKVEAYERCAVKMATGSGKTLVMAMTTAWSVLNKAANAQDTRFADAVLVVCPNLTVKERLTGLDPHRPQNEYRSFGLIPPNLQGLMGQARVLVTNWHALTPETDPKRGVMRRGPESDAAFCRRVIEPKLGKKRRILVLNDEAHHAYRHKPGAARRGEEAEEAERATVWVDGLARAHRDREVLRCVDFSATPMYVPGSGHEPWTPFPWVVSDFALVDAIESGLVKIPRIPTDDNAGASVPKYRNLWEHVKANLPRGPKDEPDAGHPLVDYLTQVDGPLKQLAGEWQETFERWREAGRRVPPAMIVICNDTRMAEVLEDHVGRKGEAGPQLQNPANGEPARTVRIDSKLLKEAEARDDAENASAAEERLRRIVATVGKEGEPGQGVRCLVSVSMLSEGWDARNVTQILGLRAFTSQLLCEQVVGRGLRRSSYDDLSVPEYVDVYGVPFQLLPFAKAGPTRPIEPPRTTSVVALRDRRHLEITFPRVVAIVHELGMTLNIDWDAIPGLAVNPEHDPTRTRLTGIGAGVTDEQTHEFMWRSYRRQKLLFEVAARIIRGQTELATLFRQALAAVDRFVDTKVIYAKGVDERELDNELYKSAIANRLLAAIRPAADGDGKLLPVLDQFQPEGSTEPVAFSTAKPVEPTTRSHVNYVVCDSELERQIAHELEADERVEAYVKNDHLFCEIPYRHEGRTLRYIPDFLVRLPAGRHLLVEGKGRERLKDQAKQTAASRWVAAVNADGRWGVWSHVVVRHRSEVRPAISETLRADSAPARP